jgi:CDP-glycerol glycerophosphotransferase (TagB/SpsB family)
MEFFLLNSLYLKLKHVLANVTFNILYFASGFFRKDPNMWVFGSPLGQRFADNPKYLFLYVTKNHPNITCVWLSSNTDVIEKLRQNGYSAFNVNSLEGFLHSLRAGCVIVSDSLWDVNRTPIRGAKVVQLWHGTPLKRLLVSSTHRTLRNHELLFRFWQFLRNLMVSIFGFELERYDITIATSQESRAAMLSTFDQVPEVRSNKNVVVTGYPRNDVLLDAGWSDDDCPYLENIKGTVDFAFVICYLPTWRRQDADRKRDLLFDYNFDADEAEALLTRINAVLIMKVHRQGAKLALHPEHRDLKSRIFIPSDTELPDIYPLLKRVNILITDYSSVYFDFLLLDRPIIFAPFDLHEFVCLDGQELFYEYNEVTPGPKATDWNKVLALVERSLHTDEYKAQRKEICQRFNEFHDGKNSERVYAIIKKSLQ